MKRLALLCLLVLSLRADVVLSERAPDADAAWSRAHEIALSCPWPPCVILSVPATGSMIPALDEGCIVVMASKPWGEFSVGDVGSFRRRGIGFVEARHVLHRAVAVFVRPDGTKRFILRGDNNSFPDSGTFGEEEYEGAVYAVIRFRDVPLRHSTRLPFKSKNK